VKNSGYVCYSSIYSLLYHDSASLAWMHLCLKTAIKKLSDVVGRRLDSHKVDERNGAEKPIASIFLLACPFWGGNGWRYSGYEELMLPEDGATKLSRGGKIFLYHCRDDATVPFDHLALYAQILPEAAVNERDEGGHQFNNDLSFVAEDIKSLQL